MCKHRVPSNKKISLRTLMNMGRRTRSLDSCEQGQVLSTSWTVGNKTITYCISLKAKSSSDFSRRFKENLKGEKRRRVVMNSIKKSQRMRLTPQLLLLRKKLKTSQSQPKIKLRKHLVKNPTLKRKTKRKMNRKTKNHHSNKQHK